MIQWGINALNHGSSLAVFEQGQLKSWARDNNDELSSEVKRAALNWGGPSEIFWYERPWIKKMRQVRAGQYSTAMDMSVLPRRYIKRAGMGYARLRYTPHHASHAAAGYYTSPFNHCAIVVLDAIGEFECASIWQGLHGEIKKVWSKSYPHSLGLFYSAFTQMMGLTPIRDEYLLQKMAEQGDPRRFKNSVDLYFKPGGPINLDYNFHCGVNNWSNDLMSIQEQCDLAAAVQERFETEVANVMSLACLLTNSDCLVYMGGCAMNSRANKNKVEPRFKHIWSLPQPGDPSSSIGSVLYHTKQRVWNWAWDPVKHIEIKV